MNVKQLMVAAGLMILTTACKENDTVNPSDTLLMSGSPAPATIDVVDDSVYTTEGKGKPIKLNPIQETPTPKQDVMPTQLQSEI